MQALVLTNNRKICRTEMDSPADLAPDAAEIGIELTGICGTDMAVLTGRENGTAGIIRGHEAVGTVLRTGAHARRLAAGDRVVIDPNEYCGSCDACRAGETNLCYGAAGQGLAISGVNQHGTFAERYIAPERFLYVLPETMTWEAAVLVEPVACVLNNISAAGLKAGDRVLIMGAGPMGLVALLVMRALGISAVATEISRFRLDFAAAMGLSVLTPGELAEHLPDRSFDAVLDTVGDQLETAFGKVRRGGKVILFGFHDGYRFPLPVKQMLTDAVSIIGAGEYNQGFPRALRIAALIPELGNLITHRFSLDTHDDAFRLLGSGEAKAMKVVFTPNGTTRKES